MNNKEVVIRPMSEEDVDQVMQLWLETNIQTHDFISDAYWRSQYEGVREMVSRSEVYVCELSEKVVGFVGLAENYIAGIFVASEVRSQGLGKRLLEYVKGLKSGLRLHVYQKNHRAVKFYRREGFVIERERMDEHTGEKEFLMRYLI